MSNDTRDAGSSADTPPDWRTQLLIEQIKECWADIRNYDTILWAIPAAN